MAKVLGRRGGILINQSRDSCLNSAGLASESSKGPVLLSAVPLLGVSGSARTLGARIDFQLGTNEVHLTENAAAWQALHVRSGEPSSMARIFPAGKRGKMASIRADVPISCTRMRVYGALVHIRGNACNSPATPGDSLANALTGRLSQ